MPGSFKWFLPSGFPTKTLYAPIRDTCPVILSLLDLNTKVSHPYKTTGKISSVYLDLYIFRQQSGRQKFLPE